MNFEPQRFFIGMMEFFTIILPGLLFTCLFGLKGLAMIAPDALVLEETPFALLLLFSSYLCGHFIFLLGAAVVDPLLYEPFRRASPRQQLARLAQGKPLAPRWLRWLAGRMVKLQDDLAQEDVIRLKQQRLAPLGLDASINAFQWAKARLALEQPGALAVVQRFEADQKFFRSLVVVLSIIVLGGAVQAHWPLVAAGALLLPLSLWRYVDQRLKGVSQAYWFVITLEGRGDAPPEPGVARYVYAGEARGRGAPRG